MFWGIKKVMTRPYSDFCAAKQDANSIITAFQLLGYKLVDSDIKLKFGSMYQFVLFFKKSKKDDEK